MNELLLESPADGVTTPAYSNNAAAGDIVRMYLLDMRQIPLLSHEQETALARRIEQATSTILKAVSRSRVTEQGCQNMGSRRFRCQTP